MSGMEHLVLFCYKCIPPATPPHGNVKYCRLRNNVTICHLLYLVCLIGGNRALASDVSDLNRSPTFWLDYVNSLLSGGQQCVAATNTVVHVSLPVENIKDFILLPTCHFVNLCVYSLKFGLCGKNISPCFSVL